MAKKVSNEEILDLLKSGHRPVWTGTDLADQFNFTRQAAYQRLTELEEKRDDVAKIQVGQSTAFFSPGVACDTVHTELDPVDRQKGSLKRYFTDKFVGLQAMPWTAIHPASKEATAGDKVQLNVEGKPGQWREMARRPWEDRQDSLYQLKEDRAQALISGELYTKASTPIEHIDYPDDYDLEEKIGVEIKGDPPNHALVAVGAKNHLLFPSNDAVFLTNIDIDFFSSIEEGKSDTDSEVTVSDEFLEELENNILGM